MPIRKPIKRYVSFVNGDDNVIVALDAQDLLGLLEPQFREFEFKSAQESILRQAIEQTQTEDKEDLIADLCNYVEWLDS